MMADIKKHFKLLILNPLTFLFEKKIEMNWNIKSDSVSQQMESEKIVLRRKICKKRTKPKTSKHAMSNYLKERKRIAYFKERRVIFIADGCYGNVVPMHAKMSKVVIFKPEMERIHKSRKQDEWKKASLRVVLVKPHENWQVDEREPDQEHEQEQERKEWDEERFWGLM